jgi:hypothetical protein
MRISRITRLVLSRCLTIVTMIFAVNQSFAAENSFADIQLQVQRLQDLRAQIEQERSTQGVYSADLLRSLNDLLEALLSAGAYQEALDAVQEQLQIIRINDGLYSNAQLSLVLTELEIMAARGNWTGLSERLAYLEWLFPRMPDTAPETRIAALKQARDWYRLLLLRGPRLMEAQYLLNMRALEMTTAELAAAGELPREQESRHLYDLALSELYVALGMVTMSDTSPQLINNDLGLQTPSQRPVSRISSVADLEAVYGARTTTVIERAHRSAMTKHQRLINQVGDLYADDLADNPEIAGMLQLHLGDSLLMRQQYELRQGTNIGPSRGSANIGGAGAYYAEAWQLLLDAGYRPDQLNEIFACPTLLPLIAMPLALEIERAECSAGQDGAFVMSDIAVTRHGIPGLRYETLPQTSLVPAPEGTRAIIRFNVGMNGQPERIQVEESEPDSTSARIRGRDALQTLQFRPALRDGRPIRTQNIKITVFTLESE